MVHGQLSIETVASAVKTQFQPSREAYTDEASGPVRDFLVQLNTEQEGRQADPDAIYSRLQNGQKSFQLRLWIVGVDETLDSNTPALISGIEIVVHRALLFRDDEMFYRRAEMLQDQQRLTDLTTWRAIVEVFGVNSMAIDSVPERLNNTLRYTVTGELVIQPEP